MPVQVQHERVPLHETDCTPHPAIERIGQEIDRAAPVAIQIGVGRWQSSPIMAYGVVETVSGPGCSACIYHAPHFWSGPCCWRSRRPRHRPRWRLSPSWRPSGPRVMVKLSAQSPVGRPSPHRCSHSSSDTATPSALIHRQGSAAKDTWSMVKRVSRAALQAANCGTFVPSVYRQTPFVPLPI